MIPRGWWFLSRVSRLLCTWEILLIWFPPLIPIGQRPVASFPSLANFPLSGSFSSTQETFPVHGQTACLTLSNESASPEAEGPAQLRRCLSHRHEDLVLKKVNGVIPTLGKQRQGDAFRSLATVFRNWWVQANKSLCLKGSGLYSWDWHLRLSSDCHMYTYACRRTHRHTLTHTDFKKYGSCSRPLRRPQPGFLRKDIREDCYPELIRRANSAFPHSRSSAKTLISADPFMQFHSLQEHSVTDDLVLWVPRASFWSTHSLFFRNSGSTGKERLECQGVSISH